MVTDGEPMGAERSPEAAVPAGLVDHFDLLADLAEAAARLYAALHEAALSGQPRIAVAPIPDEGIGVAINDRLRRAAA